MHAKDALGKYGEDLAVSLAHLSRLRSTSVRDFHRWELWGFLTRRLLRRDGECGRRSRASVPRGQPSESR